MGKTRPSRRFIVQGFTHSGMVEEYQLLHLSLDTAIKYAEKHLERESDKYEKFKVLSMSRKTLKNIQNEK